MKAAWLMSFGLAATGAVAGAPEVVADAACPYYAVDIAAFATCDGDRVAHAAAESARSEVPAPDARAQLQLRSAPALSPDRRDRRAKAVRARPLQR